MQDYCCTIARGPTTGPETVCYGEELLVRIERGKRGGTARGKDEERKRKRARFHPNASIAWWPSSLSLPSPAFYLLF